jgi:hypothetical protein
VGSYSDRRLDACTVTFQPQIFNPGYRGIGCSRGKSLYFPIRCNPMRRRVQLSDPRLRNLRACRPMACVRIREARG